MAGQNITYLRQPCLWGSYAPSPGFSHESASVLRTSAGRVLRSKAYETLLRTHLTRAYAIGSSPLLLFRYGASRWINLIFVAPPGTG